MISSFPHGARDAPNDHGVMVSETDPSLADPGNGARAEANTFSTSCLAEVPRGLVSWFA